MRCLQALLRWFPAGGEVVSPARFIPAAASGLIISIGEWVLDTACVQLAVWRQAASGPFEAVIRFQHVASIKGQLMCLVPCGRMPVRLDTRP
ncbi:EAL domain-containing protein [Deinococcus sp. AJ005]|uniref:EAL domain-containing protein n=1 Tax=Deinococcus sp. AJ005 TaxID=2652443 RepID=UPI00125CB532|nr:EAL domain-containing protein [Deinococcus sp. AJ005]